MKKTIRVYYLTYVDVPLESDGFSSKDEMIDYAEEISDILITPQDSFDHLAICGGDSEIVDV